MIGHLNRGLKPWFYIKQDSSVISPLWCAAVDNVIINVQKHVAVSAVMCLIWNRACHGNTRDSDACR